MRKSNARIKTFTEIIRDLRNGWGNVNPVTKIIPNKKKASSKRKYKEAIQNED